MIPIIKWHFYQDAQQLNHHGTECDLWTIYPCHSIVIYDNKQAPDGNNEIVIPLNIWFHVKSIG